MRRPIRGRLHPEKKRRGLMLQVKNVRKAFGDNQVLRGVDIEVKKGDIVVILGPSGSGKTTFLRCLNFL